MPAPPLAGLNVIDLSTVVAGPGCTRYLADFGATVINVERPPGGDTTRAMGFPDPNDPDGTSLFWKIIGRNKRCVVLDLKDPADVERVLRLAEGAHVLVENLRPGGLEKLGLGPDELLARNPNLVITRVTGFGQDGPYANRPGFATIAEAMSGFAGLNGEADGAPMLPPIALTDELTAMSAAFATMTALHSGVGQVVDVNLLGVVRGIHAACGKRPIAEDVKEKIADVIEEELHREFDREVESRIVGERVMARLRDTDEVAYIRFASEYLKFRSVDDIMQQLEAGTVYMNRCDYLDPELAWVGVRDSGRGVTLSRFGFDGFTRLKSLHLRHAIP